eukprot:gene6591-6331_t
MCGPVRHARTYVSGAVSVPLFSDEARVEVGTMYKLGGRGAALT